jgi:hypothetical protein
VGREAVAKKHHKTKNGTEVLLPSQASVREAQIGFQTPACATNKINKN